MAPLLSTTTYFDERLAVEDGQLTTWYVTDKGNKEMTKKTEKVEVRTEEMMERGKRERAKNINQSRSLGELTHETQSDTQAQCETGEIGGLFQSHEISWTTLWGDWTLVSC